MKIQHIPIIGKVLIVIVIFAVVSIASAVFSTGKIRDIANGYVAAIDQDRPAGKKQSSSGRAAAVENFTWNS